MYMEPLNVCVFSENKDQIPIETSSPADLVSWNSSVAVSSSSTSRTTSKLLAEVVQAPTLLQQELRVNPALSHHMETKQRIIKLALPRT